MENVGLEKHELPPTNQKRMIAFINHFVVSTVNFLNKFASNCEEKFITYEHKLQNVEASLMILEGKLASIKHPINNEKIEPETIKPEVIMGDQDKLSDNPLDEKCGDVGEVQNFKNDPQYEKFFKMVNVGVPRQAVKNKMLSEGLDPSILDNP